MIGLFLFIVAIFLIKIFIMPSFVYKLLKDALEYDSFKDFEKSISTYFKEIAIAIDKLGNIIMGPILNCSMIRGKDRFLFGLEDQTISFAFARNIIGIDYNKDIRLTLLGKLIVWLIRKIDPGHFKKSYNNNSNN